MADDTLKEVYEMPHEMSFLEKVRGKRTNDIELPNDSGKTDPRLKKPDPIRGLELAGKHLHQLREKGLFKKGAK